MFHGPASFNAGDAMRQRFKDEITRAKSISDIKRIFSDTARCLVGEMLDGEIPIDEDAILLVAENGGAIFIQESLSSSPAFQKICHDTPCISILLGLAEIALNGVEKEPEEIPS